MVCSGVSSIVSGESDPTPIGAGPTDHRHVSQLVGCLKEAKMNKLSQELMRQVLQPAMHQKLLIRAAELVARA